jgi:opacity protein-like surface antigen
MRKFIIPAVVLAAVASAALPAAAQSYGHHGRPPVYQAGYGQWQSINARQDNLDRRIDQGVRTGQLSRREATRLRGEFNGLLRLEANYRRGGLTAWERTDLDRRFDRLSAQVRNERHDRDNRRG